MLQQSGALAVERSVWCSSPLVAHCTSGQAGGHLVYRTWVDCLCMVHKPRYAAARALYAAARKLAAVCGS